MTEPNRVPYIVVRYHHDRVREQAINIGVIVQTERGLDCKLVDDMAGVHRAYPFLDVGLLERRIQAVNSALASKEFTLFDYEANRPVDVAASDRRLLSQLPRLVNHDLEFSAPKYAELAALAPAEVAALVGFLFDTFVQPPTPKRQAVGLPAEPTPRPAHSTLHRAAKRKILAGAAKAGFRDEVEVDAAVSGKTRKWHFDLKIRPAIQYVHHVLVLPDLEETYIETAALGRIWQDVKGGHPKARLAAVYYSRDGVPRGELHAAEKLLAKDDIDTVFFDQLQSFYIELRGQRRLSPA